MWDRQANSNAPAAHGYTCSTYGHSSADSYARSTYRDHSAAHSYTAAHGHARAADRYRNVISHRYTPAADSYPYAASQRQWRRGDCLCL